MLQTLAGSLRRHWYMAALLVLFVGLGLKYRQKALQNRSAILRWQPQILEMARGEDISLRFSYPNPPIMAIILEPLAQLPPVTAALTWFYFKAFLVMVTLVWVFRLIETPEKPFPAWAKGLTILLSLRPIMGDLDHGNVNLFILFLVVAALTAYRKGMDLLAGCTLGLAIACKVTPALFIPYFFWKRSWKALVGCLAGLLLFLWPGVAPALRLGWQENQQQLVSWYRDMVHPFIVEGRVWSEHKNQSLTGLVYRLATHSPSFDTYVDDVYTPTQYDNFADLTTRQARWVVKGFMGLFALLVVWTCRTPTVPRQGWRLGAEFALVLLGMLLFSERTWKHHCVTLVAPFAVLCYSLAVESRTRNGKIVLVGVLMAVTGLIASTSTGTRIWPDAWAEQAQVYGAYVMAYLVLGATLVVLLKRREARTAAGNLARPAPPANAA